VQVSSDVCEAPRADYVSKLFNDVLSTVDAAYDDEWEGNDCHLFDDCYFTMLYQPMTLLWCWMIIMNDESGVGRGLI
jgi:hypothetical protein